MEPEIEDIQKKLDRLLSVAEEARALAGAAYERIEAVERGEDRLARIRATDAWKLAYASERPLVSVRIATRNRAELLTERALASVRRQTYDRWEAVVVGSACTDDTESRIAALGDERIRFLNLNVDGPYPDDRLQTWLIAGVPSMNAAVRMARGAWIAPLDDDDELDDDHLETLVAAAQAEQAEFAYGRIRTALGGEYTGKTFGEWPPREGKIGLGGAIYNAALSEFRHDQNARFMEEAHDWNLVRRMWQAGVRFTFVDKVVATYHRDHAKDLKQAVVRELGRPDGTSLASALQGARHPA